MSLDSVSVNIIQRARKEKPAPVIHSSELKYVLDHQSLTPLDKLLWAKLACSSVLDASLCCDINLGIEAFLLRASKEELLDALLRLQSLEFLRVGFDVRVKALTDINHLLRMGDRPEGFISQIKSIHCQLLLPRQGLINLLTKPNMPPPSKAVLYEIKRCQQK